MAVNRKTSTFLFCILLLAALFLIFGCTSPVNTSICGDGICSQSEQDSCSCSADCGLACTPVTPTTPNNPSNPNSPSTPTLTDTNIVDVSTPVATIPLQNISAEIPLSGLLSGINLSSISIPALSISGSLELPNKNDYLRVILVGADGKEYLVFEAYYPLYQVGSVSFDSICNETCNLGNIQPKSLKIETNITDPSKIRLSSLSISSGQKRSQKTNIVQRINANLIANNEAWVAGDTPLSNLSYSQKKAMYGDGSVAPPAGFEYYVGGVFGSPQSNDSSSYSFITPFASSSSSTSASLPSSWDWRQRNGKNWITPVRDQGQAGLCWAFASTAAVESAFNLYYNDLLNYDLAEEEFYCGNFNNLYFSANRYGPGSSNTGGFPYQALGYIKKTGVVDESCLPYLIDGGGSLIGKSCTSALSVDCSKFTFLNGSFPYGYCSYLDTNCAFCKNKNFASGLSECASTRVFSIGDFNRVGVDNYSALTDANIFLIKKTLIEKGPLTVAANLYSTLNSDTNITSHVMLLVGYETDSQGRTVLIFKNSWGPTWGTGGYAKTYVPSMFNVFYVLNPIIKSNGSTPAVRCVDDDNDSYCSWGIGPRPTTCPAKCAANPQDCDDSNPGLLGFDSNYSCVNVNSGTIDFNSNPIGAQVWVDGNYKTNTPARLDFVAGAHKVLIKMDDFKVYATLVDLNKAQTKYVNAVLERDPNLLWKKSDPFGTGANSYLVSATIHSRILIKNPFADTGKFYVYFGGSPTSSSNHYYDIQSAYICERESDLNCLSSTLKQITFSGGSSVRVNEAALVQSDVVDYALSKNKSYLILFFSTGNLSVLDSADTVKYSSIDTYGGYAVLAYDTDIKNYVDYEDSRSFGKSIYGLEKVVSVSTTSECGNGVCEADEVYSSCPFDCPATKQCLNTDPCCASNLFKSSGTICEQSATKELYCDTNNTRLLQRSYNKVCLGTSSDCTQKAYSAGDVNAICSQTCRSDINACSAYACWPFGKDENISSGSSIGACKLEIKKRTCAAGTWSDWNILQTGILPAPEVCDANGVDENCNGSVNEGCLCTNGLTQNCAIQSECGVGKQTCVNGVWGTCQQVGGLAPNTSCGGTGSGKVCDLNGNCIVPACKTATVSSDCQNSNLCKTVSCSNSGLWNASCVLTSKAVNSSCGVGNLCSADGNCVSAFCTADLNCTSSDPCQIGSCSNKGLWNASCAFTNKAVNTSCGAGKLCSTAGVCTSITCLTDSNCVSANSCLVGSCSNKGLWNSSCSFTNKAANVSCGAGKLCALDGNCVSVACTADLNCVSSDPCKIGSCSNKGLWNASCTYTDKNVNSSCGAGKVCNATGVCTSAACSADSNCVSANSCLVGSCSNKGLWNASCSFASKAANSSCGVGSLCSIDGNCVSVACTADLNCTSSDSCKSGSCSNKGLWNSSCVFASKPVNSSCGVGKVCSDVNACVSTLCTSDSNCVSQNPCQAGTCLNKGLWNASCAFANKTEYFSCAQKSFCVSGVCTAYSSPKYNPSTFNGTNAPAKVVIDNNTSIDKNYFGLKTVAIQSSSGVAIASFDHNFSSSDLNLLGSTIESGAVDLNKNYLIVKGLQIQGTKSIYLPKRNSSSNAVCVSNAEVPDLNNLRSTCTSMPCPGTLGSISCAVLGSSFVVSGLTHSGVVEDYLFCGDGNCNNNETCSSCASDCGACPTPPSGTPSNVVCSQDSQCGTSSFTGAKSCVNNDVRQTFRDWNCLNKGTSSSRCVATDTNRTVESCLASAGKSCVNGACVSSQVAEQPECVLDSNCALDEGCVGTSCEKVSCSAGYSVENHACVCSGKMCAETCHTGVGVCCEGTWLTNKTTCVISPDNNINTDFNVDTSSADSNKDQWSWIDLSNPALIGGAVLVIVVILVLAFVFMRKGKKPPESVSLDRNNVFNKNTGEDNSISLQKEQILKDLQNEMTQSNPQEKNYP